MVRYQTPISLRLAVGLVLVLGVLGLPLLLTLNQLGSVKAANEKLDSYLQVRKDALALSDMAAELSKLHRSSRREGGTDPPWPPRQLERLMAEIDHQVANLRIRELEEPERGYVDELAGAAASIRKLVGTPSGGEPGRGGGGPNPAIRAFSKRAAEFIERIQRASKKLADTFEVRMQQASNQTERTWQIGMAMAKIVFPLALLVGFLIIYYTHRSILGPVESLVERTRALAKGDLSSRMEFTGAGEFAELAHSFNQMAQALEANQKQLVEAEKLATVGRLAAGVAHEINNPVTVILGHTKMLLGKLESDSAAKEQLRNIAGEAKQCQNIINSLLDLSRPSEVGGPQPLNPNAVVGEVLSMAQTLHITREALIERSVVDRTLELNISYSRLRRLVLNIVRNALEVLADSEEGRLLIEGYVRPREKLPEPLRSESDAQYASFLVLVFTDNGPGIPPDELQHLFEPFFTTKPDGIGLGLAICYNITRTHGGFIDVQSEPGEGTAVTVGLPLAGKEA